MIPPKKSDPSNDATPLILMAVGFVLIVLVLIWQLYLSESKNYSHSMVLPSATSEIPYPEITCISLKDARSALDQQTAVFIDVRSADSFDKGHIPGAINLPLDQLESKLSQLDPTSWIIPYCT